MALDTEQKTDAAAREAARPTDPSQTVARDRRAVRAEDLSEDAIAALEASEMEPGFEHLDAELDPPVRLWSMLASTSAASFGRAAMPPRDSQPTKRFAIACTTIPDRDFARGKPPASNSTGREGNRLSRKGGRGLARDALSPFDLGPSGMIFERPDAQNR